MISSKFCTQVASQVAKQLKVEDLKKLGNENKISKLGGDRLMMSSLSTEIYFLALAVSTYTETDI